MAGLIVDFNESDYAIEMLYKVGIRYKHCALCVHAEREGGDFPCMDCLSFPVRYPYFSPVTAPMVIIIDNNNNNNNNHNETPNEKE
jgi:hypothetical protein